MCYFNATMIEEFHISRFTAVEHFFAFPRWKKCFPIGILLLGKIESEHFLPSDTFCVHGYKQTVKT